MARNASARASAFVGLLAAAALPVAVALAETTGLLRLVEAGGAIPAAFVLGVIAVALARRGRRRASRTVARVGEGSARFGRWFGALGIALAAAGTIALAFYCYLDRIGA